MNRKRVERRRLFKRLCEYLAEDQRIFFEKEMQRQIHERLSPRAAGPRSALPALFYFDHLDADRMGWATDLANALPASWETTPEEFWMSRI